MLMILFGKSKGVIIKILIIIAIILIAITRVLFHELGHYIAYFVLGGCPKLGFYKGSAFIASMVDGFERNKRIEAGNDAWKIELILVGSGWLFTLILGIVNVFLFVILSDYIILSLVLLISGVFDLGLFFSQTYKPYHDGVRVIRALKMRGCWTPQEDYEIEMLKFKVSQMKIKYWNKRKQSS